MVWGVVYVYFEVRLGSKHRDSLISIIEDPNYYSIFEGVFDNADPAISICLVYIQIIKLEHSKGLRRQTLYLKIYSEHEEKKKQRQQAYQKFLTRDLLLIDGFHFGSDRKKSLQFWQF